MSVKSLNLREYYFLTKSSKCLPPVIDNCCKQLQNKAWNWPANFNQKLLAIYTLSFSAFPEVPVSLYEQFSWVKFAAAHFYPVLVFCKRSYFACNFHCLSVVTESMHFLKVTMTQNTLELFVFEWQDGRINCSALHIEYQWIMDYLPLLLVIIRCEIENIWLRSRKCACHRMQYSLSFLCFFLVKRIYRRS